MSNLVFAAALWAAVAAADAPLTWWSLSVAAPGGTEIEGLPLRALDPSWVGATALRPEMFPAESRTHGFATERGATWNLLVDLDRDGRHERAIVGVYQDRKGGTGRFLLILRETESGWKKRALFKQPGEASLSVVFLPDGALAWAACVECDTLCGVNTRTRPWTLECDSCCED